MDCVKALTNIPINDIQKYLADCKQEFETSQLYSAARDEKFTDEDLRKSTFRTITDNKLFDLVDNVIARLNEDEQASYRYTLRRNDVTHIKYEEGGFFKRHRDYLSTTSNLIEEYTLLLCVTPQDNDDDDDDAVKNKEGGSVNSAVVGGETIIHTYGGATAYDTTTTGSGILFRKDLEHEGAELISGEKHIITANIWAMRKEQSKQVLLVTFPQEGKEANMEQPSLKDVASASTSYVLPVDVLTGMLAAHVQWANRTAEDEDKEIPPVVTYECPDFDFATFGVVEKVLNRSYVDENAIFAAKDCLDYFGPFNRSDMLVDLSLESAKTKAPDNTCASCGKEDSGDMKLKICACKLVKYCSVECQKNHRKQHKRECRKRLAEIESREAKESSTAEDFDSSLIVCESEARMHAVANVAAALGENHYVPFKMLFVEGVLEAMCESDISVVEVPMMPAACLLGDHNNIFCLRKIVSKSSVEPASFSDIHTKSNVFKQIPASVLESALSAVSPGDEINLLDKCNVKYAVKRDLKDNGYGLGLRLGIQSSSDVKSAILDAVLHETYGMVGMKSKTVYLPGLLNPTDEVDDNVSLFHHNERGEVVFSEKEAARASDFIASSGIEERVKAALQKKRFLLPQEVEGVDAHFCNEMVYGKVNILWVCGVIRMEATNFESEGEAAGATTCQNFDVWPTAVAKYKTDHAREFIRARALNFTGY